MRRFGEPGRRASVQTGQPQPKVGTAIEVPVPKKVRLACIRSRVPSQSQRRGLAHDARAAGKSAWPTKSACACGTGGTTRLMLGGVARESLSDLQEAQTEVE